MYRHSLKVLINNHRSFKKEHVDIIYLSNQWCHSARTITDYGDVKLLVRLLGITESNALKIVNSKNRLSQKAEHQIIKSYDICVKHGMDNETLSNSPNILFFTPSQLEQRISYLKDAGFDRISPDIITFFHSKVNSSVTNLKLQHMLPPHADVPKNLLSCIEEPPPHVPPHEPLTEDLSVSQIYEKILRHYLKWKLELADEKLDIIMKSRTRMKYQSLRMVKEMLDLLENELGLSKERIRRKHCLFSKSPSNTKQILNNLEYIGAVETKAMIKKYPRILRQPAEGLQHKLTVLKELGVRDVAISNSPNILTLSIKTITERIAEFHSLPQLKGLWSHPRIMTLISCLPQAKKRMAILSQLNVRCASLHILCTAPGFFNRFILVGADRTKGRDLLRFLNYELGVDIEMIQATMKRHTFWCQVPFIHVQETFVFLKEQNYSNEDILNNIHIVLYRSSRIEQELNNIDSSSDNESWDMTPSRKLALCLYNIEKKYHFNGNGVWNCEKVSGREEEQNSQSIRQSSKV